MKVVICWAENSGYMSASLRALTKLSGVEVFYIAFATTGAAAQTAFSHALLEGIEHRFLDADERNDVALVSRLVIEQKPDVVFLAGWLSHAYKQLVDLPELKAVKFIMAMDGEWRGTIRQRLAPIRLKHYLSRITAIFTWGERSWQFASRLGMPPERIYRGMVGMDYDGFAKAFDTRKTLAEWPRKFLYVGRYSSEKAIDTMLAAYAIYRGRSKTPWSLTCVGRGPLGEMIRAALGVTDAGFVQLSDQPAIFAEHGAFVLASRYEPWGVVVAEAAASGLPTICTDAVCGGVELVRNFYNGRRIATDNVAELADAMSWMEEHHAILPLMGARAQPYAEAHAAQIWADNLMHAASRPAR